MENRIGAILLFLTSLTLWGCQAPSIPVEVATEIATGFIEGTSSGDYEKAFKYVNKKEFFAVRDADQWKAYYDSIAKEMGPVISIKLSRHQADDRFSGRFYTYQFSIKHENGFTKEIVTLIQEINSDEDLKVFAHRVEGGKLAKINRMF